MDELRGRAAARSLGLPVMGTLGVLLEAKRRGLIPAIKPELDRLRQSTRFHATDDIYNYVLQLADE
jgi:predicted nucleic acid-binding protein